MSPVKNTCYSFQRLGLVPSTHMVTHLPLALASWDQMPSSGLHGTRHTHTVHACIKTGTCTLKIRIDTSFICVYMSTYIYVFAFVIYSPTSRSLTRGWKSSEMHCRFSSLVEYLPSKCEGDPRFNPQLLLHPHAFRKKSEYRQAFLCHSLCNTEE